MFWKQKDEKVFEQVDIKSGIDLLQEQIDAVKQLLDNRPIQSKDHESWNNKTHEYLVKIYGERSPNIDTITEASGDAPTWLFLPDEAAERFEASCLENQKQLLKGCVKALKLKAKASQNS